MGVAPWSSDAKTSGWSPSTVNGVRWVCSAPSPKKSCTVVRLCVPLTHSQRARHRNCAASGASASASRAPSSASTLTPLSTAGLSTVLIPLLPPAHAAHRARRSDCDWHLWCLTQVQRTRVARRLHPTCKRTDQATAGAQATATKTSSVSAIAPSRLPQGSGGGRHLTFHESRDNLIGNSSTTTRTNTAEPHNSRNPARPNRAERNVPTIRRHRPSVLGLGGLVHEYVQVA